MQRLILATPLVNERRCDPNEDAALLYAIAAQSNRRNVTDAELLRCVERVDRIKARGGDRKSEKSKSADAPFDSGSSAEETAEALGVIWATDIRRETSHQSRRVALSMQQ